MNTAYAVAYPDLYRRHWWWRARERVLLDLIPKLVEGATTPRLLDIGCGAGLFFDALEPFGHVEGVETDRVAREMSGRWRSRIHERLSADLGQFDLVLMLDVLEHVEDPVALLRNAADRLSQNGHLVVTVPAFMTLWTSHDVLNEHRRRYTSTTLRADLTASGLQVERTRYLFQSLVVPKLASRLLEAIHPSPPRVPQVPGAGITAALTAWLAAERRLFSWLPFGGSVLAIAHKSHQTRN